VQIENIELLELFMETVCDVPEEHAQSSTTQAATQISTLAQQLGNNRSLMANLAESYAINGEEKLARATRQLVNALEDESLLSPPEQDAHTRLVKYVYPVV